MVATLDGAASGGDGRSGSISAPADVAVFGVLRALADVVLVGAGTVRAEGYGAAQPRPTFADRRAAAGQAPAAALAVVTRSGFVPGDTGLFSGDGADVRRHDRRRGPRPAAVPGRLRARDRRPATRRWTSRTPSARSPPAGLRRVLLEGGPTLLGSALAAGRVDELCLTWSPLLVGGDAPRIAVGPPVKLAARPAHLIAAGRPAARPLARAALATARGRPTRAVGRATRG